MEQLREREPLQIRESQELLRVSVIVAARNEARNLPRCLDSLRDVAEVYVIDSQSTDTTADIAHRYGAKLVQFYYHGGWPKKRQWAMDTLPLACDWILLLDADEVLTPDLKAEIRSAIETDYCAGYYIALQMHFLGRRLRYADASFWKLALFRRGYGRFECRLMNQNLSMTDIEVHEHVMVDGPASKLKSPVIHHNVNSLFDYIQKHNEYSNWEARVWTESSLSRHELPARLWGTQAQRRRWLRKRFLHVPGSPVAFFFYKYLFCLGFLDGVPGLIYCCFQSIQFFHIKAKIYELQSEKTKPGQCAESAA
jgi:glycosyltransferase involved in cell wall biosynthesis